MTRLESHTSGDDYKRAKACALVAEGRTEFRLLRFQRRSGACSYTRFYVPCGQDMPEFLHHGATSRAELIDLVAPMVENIVIAPYPTPRDAFMQGIQFCRGELQEGTIGLVQNEAESSRDLEGSTLREEDRPCIVGIFDKPITKFTRFMERRNGPYHAQPGLGIGTHEFVEGYQKVAEQKLKHVCALHDATLSK